MILALSGKAKEGRYANRKKCCEKRTHPQKREKKREKMVLAAVQRVLKKTWRR